MKSILFFCLNMFFLHFATVSQTCLPDGITFTTQEQIDNFSKNYPNCKSVGGRLTISGSDITNLNGLSQLTSANSIYIYKNNVLTSLYGLHNIRAVYELRIGTMELNRGGNPLLTSLNGLDALTNISYKLEIYDNNSLTSLTGLDNLTYIGMSLSISENEKLSNIISLKSLNTIGYAGGITWGFGISIHHTALITLEGLENLTNFRGGIHISENQALTSITGIENIILDSLTSLWICDNPSLVTCNSENLCNYLKNPRGEVSIYNNADGCDSPSEMAQACGIIVPCLPFGNYYFLSQSDINNFKVNYPDCNELAGDVTIKGDDIVSLNGLTGVSLITGNLYIDSCRFLGNLAGLDSLTKVGSSIYLNYNDALRGLTGLNKLKSIGWGFGLRHSPLLTNLSGLENLTSTGGGLYIKDNTGLTSLTGLDNLSTTHWVQILDNPKLTSIASLNKLNSLEKAEATLWIMDNYSLETLDGLNNITKVEGNVWIEGNKVLKDLKGLSNLKTINGSVDISYNPALTSLTGLENLNLIEFDLWLLYNDSIRNLTGLEKLISLGRSLVIFGNPSLVSLVGIQNMDTASISDLYISENFALSDCSVKSICAYLVKPDAVVTIENNLKGCNSREEVESACATKSGDFKVDNDIILFPNPAFQTITINAKNETIVDEVIFYNQSGQKVLYTNPYNNTLDISKLKSGLYIVELLTKQGKFIKKLLVR